MASVHARAVILRRTEYESDTDYNIALVVATHMGGDGRPATVSLATIAGFVRCHYNTADKRTKAMSEKGQLIIGRGGRLLTYAVPYDGEDGEPESSKVAEVDTLRAEVVELKEKVENLTAVVKELHTIVTSTSHDLHTIFTLLNESGVNEVGKIERIKTPQTPQGEGVVGKSKTQTLVDHFCDKTNIRPPKKQQQKAWLEGWLEPLNEILELTADDVTAACGLIDRAVAHMRQEGLTIARPSSILAVAQTIHAKRSGNGRKSGVSPWDEVKSRAGQREVPTFTDPLILAAVRPIWPDVRKMTPATEKQLRIAFEQKYQELTSHARN